MSERIWKLIKTQFTTQLPLSPTYKSLHSLESLTSECDYIRQKYPDRIPVIIERRNRDTPEIDNKKFLVPADLTCGQLLYVIRKRLKLTATGAIFIFVNNQLLPASVLLSQIYTENADISGYLFCIYSKEDTFGY